MKEIISSKKATAPQTEPSPIQKLRNSQNAMNKAKNNLQNKETELNLRYLKDMQDLSDLQNIQENAIAEFNAAKAEFEASVDDSPHQALQ